MLRSSQQTATLRSPDGPLGETDAADLVITFDDLLTHRAGLTYADFHRGPIAQAYREFLGGEIDSHVVPDQWIAGLAKLPSSIGQPGSGHVYSRADRPARAVDRKTKAGHLEARAEAAGLRPTGRRTPASLSLARTAIDGPPPMASTMRAGSSSCRNGE